jgi:GTP diphosphokinase / guanosine-3',5'-bis(diphosphate) 3'-diphosphatase
MELENIFQSLRLPLTNERRKRITEAYEFSLIAHAGQKRVSGEDYIHHCLTTAKILAEIGMDSKTIAAGFLHDVTEDTPVKPEEIEKKFGKEIAYMVEGVTKLGKLKLRGSREEYFLENLRKMFLAMAADIRVVIIKIANRLHNMQTLDALPPEKQLRIAQETMEIYVPLADRLGIGEIKGQLEDLSFKFIDPENYKTTKRLAEKHYLEKEKYMNQAIRELKKELDKQGIRFMDIYGRSKHLYRLYLKLRNHDMDIDRIYDQVAVRIIVSEIADCYEVLGIVHKKYHPMVGRIKDYISLPKPNGYQSIHTTVFGPEGKIIEIQIRTKKMQDESEYGIAAHWIYDDKEKKGWRKYLFKDKTTAPEKELVWVKQLREWQNEIGRNDEEFMEGLKIDFLKHRIFAFTPRGDIIDLPEEATPIDFAYSIHSEVGNNATGAKIDGKIVPLDYHIRNGQVIEIMTSKEKKSPSRDWLKFVKTSLARYQIRKHLKKDGLF